MNNRSHYREYEADLYTYLIQIKVYSGLLTKVVQPTSPTQCRYPLKRMGTLRVLYRGHSLGCYKN